MNQAVVAVVVVGGGGSLGDKNWEKLQESNSGGNYNGSSYK